MRTNDPLCEIRRAEEKVREYTASAENTRRKAYFRNDGPSGGYWFGVPADHNITPFAVEFERALYAKILGFSLVDFYTDPCCHYLNSLRILIYKFEHFRDCTPINMEFTYSPGGGFEKSIFGFRPIHSEQDSWVSKELMFKEGERAPIKDLQITDFYTSGCMPEYLEFYEKILSIKSDDISVAFPLWSRSPWALAWELRGIENLLIDTMDDLEWVDDLVNYITDCRIAWCRQWGKYTGITISSCMLGNDEVTFPLVSPELYRTIIKPTEVRLSKALGGISYWHSCGNTTPFMPEINTIPNLEVAHVSPWSDLETADRVYDTDKRLEVALFAYEDVLYPKDLDGVEKKLRSIKEKLLSHSGVVMANGIQCIKDLATELKKVDAWIEAATKVLLEGK